MSEGYKWIIIRKDNSTGKTVVEFTATIDSVELVSRAPHGAPHRTKWGLNLNKRIRRESMKELKISGNGYADSDGDRMNIEIQYGDSTFSLWLPASVKEELDSQWDRALRDATDAIESDKPTAELEKPIVVP